MPQMNFDLEDGKPPVSFSIKPDDCERFIRFMGECNGYAVALREIANMDPKGVRADDLGRAARIARSAIGGVTGPSTQTD